MNTRVGRHQNRGDAILPCTRSAENVTNTSANVLAKVFELKLEEAALIFFPELLKNADPYLIFPDAVVASWPEIVESATMTGIGWCSPDKDLYKSYATAIVFKRAMYSAAGAGHSAVITKSIAWDNTCPPSLFWIEDNIRYMNTKTANYLLDKGVRRSSGGDGQIFWKLL